MDHETELEVQRLKRTTREVIAISSLPSIWAYYEIHQIADSLVNTLYSSLILEFAYAKIAGAGEIYHAAYTRTGLLKNSDLDELILKLEPWTRAGTSVASTHFVANPLGGEDLKVNVVPIGYNFKNGILITGASRAHFPTESDRLIINIASNQTNVIAEHKWSQLEAQKLLQMAAEKETKLKEATELAEIAKIEAIHANELKSSFLANMSHEIRTPLGAILGFTDVLKTSTLSSEERNQYLEIITRSGQALTKIIDDILDLSKIEAGKLDMENLPVCLPDLCEEVLAMFSDRATGKGIRLIFDGSLLPKFRVDSDQIRIRQVLVNLIGNAVKFTSQGSITLKGNYNELADHRIRISFQVIDTGMGMPQNVAASLFKPFTQGDNTSTRKFGGTGLGLALSKKLGNALGGDVTLTHCEENKGCTFTFDFVAPKSIAAEASAKEINSQNPKNQQALKGYKLLVADDSPDNRLLLELMLTQAGADVEFAQDGEEAVAKCLNKNFDAILMDIQMPKLDGYGALAELRKKEFRRPVFALTAHAMKEERNRAMAAGFVDHIPKPVNAEQLVESILMHSRR